MSWRGLDTWTVPSVDTIHFHIAKIQNNLYYDLCFALRGSNGITLLKNLCSDYKYYIESIISKLGFRIFNVFFSKLKEAGFQNFVGIEHRYAFLHILPKLWPLSAQT